MIRNLFSFIANTTKSFIFGIIKFPIFIKKQIYQLAMEFKELRYKLNNMTNSNMELGIYHLRMRNFQDAVFRFKMIDKFLDPNNKEANYWLGWSYFFKHDYKNSIIALTKAQEADKVNLLSFIKSIDSVNEIPKEIYEFYRDAASSLFQRRFVNEDINIPKKLIFELKQSIDTLPEEYSVLDCGSNIGLLGYEIKKRMPAKANITSLEASRVMIDLQKTYFPRIKLYNKTTCQSVDEFLTKDNKKYNIIVSLDGISLSLNLEGLLSKIFLKLEKGGYFAFLVSSSNKAVFFKEQLTFVYNAKEIEDKIRKAGFNLLSSSDIFLEIKNNYTIFVCRKT